MPTSSRAPEKISHIPLVGVGKMWTYKAKGVESEEKTRSNSRAFKSIRYLKKKGIFSLSRVKKKKKEGGRKAV